MKKSTKQPETKDKGTAGDDQPQNSNSEVQEEFKDLRYKLKIKNIQQDHETEIEKLKRMHQEQLDALKEKMHEDEIRNLTSRHTEIERNLTSRLNLMQEENKELLTQNGRLQQQVQ